MCDSRDIVKRGLRKNTFRHLQVYQCKHCQKYSPLSIRLFMSPGMDHCFGPVEFDTIAVLEQWVEKGKAPDRIVATYLTTGATKPDRTRLLCPYPQVAKYKGSGSADDATNFVCTRD